MKNLTVHLDDKPIYDIVYEESFDALPSMIKELGYSNRKICVVSESHVASLYLDAILHSIKDACTYTTSFVFPEGEASKNLNVVRDLYTHLIEEKFDRNDVLIALGGGVVGDKVEIVAEYCSLGKPKNQVLEGIVGQALALPTVVSAGWEVL